MFGPVHARGGLPRADLPGWRRAIRYHFVRTFVLVCARFLFAIRLEGRENMVTGPAMYCFNHLGWLDPIVLMATFPAAPWLYFYGPSEEDLRHGARNRIMHWTGTAVPFRPEKDDLLQSVRRAQAVFDSGAVLAIAGEGRIHIHEGDLFPLQEGAAYLALRARVPIVPVAITGTSLVGFRRTIRVRIGSPIRTGVRPTRAAVAAYTSLTWHALKAMIADDHDLPVPGRFGRWFTDVFNDWGEGGREAAGRLHGPRPDEVPLPEGEWPPPEASDQARGPDARAQPPVSPEADWPPAPSTARPTG